MFRRISIYGGPGCGKTTLAAKLFAALREKGRHVEPVSEWIKLDAILGIFPQDYDQVTVLGNQIREESLRLRKTPFVLTDSPILLNTAYAEFYGFRHSGHLVALAKAFDEDYPSYNVFIDRTVPYQQSGRYQSYEQAVEFDEFLKGFLGRNLNGILKHVTVDRFDDLLSSVEGHVFCGGSHAS